ncbi:MAG: class I SAM-dependent methyltransferase [Gammaproteobacteria bacterium]|jgi:SAM-dependent methyltransferase
MSHAYREDLSWIHDLGFGDLARNAAELLLREFAAEGMDGGLVVDLGCGSGIFAEALSDAGYDVLGIDLSPAMIDLARQRVPDAEFRCESLLATALPPSTAVVAIGEVFNYRFDESSSRPARRALYERIHASLQPGGFLLFDVAGPGRVPGDGHLHTCVDGGAWALLMRAEEDPATARLTRCITSFRQAGELFRRDDECHELDLLPPEEVLDDLEAAGFTAQPLGAYHGFELPPGLHGFLARRPRQD